MQTLYDEVPVRNHPRDNQRRYNTARRTDSGERRVTKKQTSAERDYGDHELAYAEDVHAYHGPDQTRPTTPPQVQPPAQVASASTFVPPPRNASLAKQNYAQTATPSKRTLPEIRQNRNRVEVQMMEQEEELEEEPLPPPPPSGSSKYSPSRSVPQAHVQRARLPNAEPVNHHEYERDEDEDNAWPQEAPHSPPARAASPPPPSAASKPTSKRRDTSRASERRHPKAQESRHASPPHTLPIDPPYTRSVSPPPPPKSSARQQKSRPHRRATDNDWRTDYEDVEPSGFQRPSSPQPEYSAPARSKSPAYPPSSSRTHPHGTLRSETQEVHTSYHF
jgi:hypothetical protein